MEDDLLRLKPSRETEALNGGWLELNRSLVEVQAQFQVQELSSTRISAFCLVQAQCGLKVGDAENCWDISTLVAGTAVAA